MAVDTRYAHCDWDLGSPITWGKVQLALLMDIRDELQKLNKLLRCENFQAIPTTLSHIAVNTRKPRKKRRPAPSRNGH